MTRFLLAAALVGSSVAVSEISPRAFADDAWLQWGGGQRNFVVTAPALATSWPSSGPRVLWDRTLGEGHSTILVEGNRLYTMYRYAGVLSMVRRTQSETIAAMDAATGKTLWEHTYDSSTGGLDLQYGSGPHSTPLIVG